MEVGNFTNNSLRFIDVTLLVENLGMELSKSIPAFHAFTGCGYSPAFVGKGQIQQFELHVKEPECQNAFSRLGTEDIDEDLINVIQSYVSNSINEARVQNFFKEFNPKKNPESTSEAVKGFDASSVF